MRALIAGARKSIRILDHKLSAIALNHEAKLRVRLLPTYEEYRSKFGRKPTLLSALLA